MISYKLRWILARLSETRQHTTLNLAENPFFWGCNTAVSCAREHDLREVLHDVVYVSRQDKTNKASRKRNRPIRLACSRRSDSGERCEAFFTPHRSPLAERLEQATIRLTQCCTQFKSPGDKILCVLHLHYNVAFTFKWYGNSWNKTFYSQRVWIGYNIELAE